MTNSTQLFDLAQLAEASYADLTNPNNIVQALKDKNFSDSQATEFAQWTSHNSVDNQ